MIPNIKGAILFWTWVTLATCQQSAHQRINATKDLFDRIVSEKQVFFDPVNKQPVPAISQPADLSTKIRNSKNVYGSLPCSCGSDACNCCVDIKIKPLNSEDSGCVRISPSTVDHSMMDTEISLNNQTMASARLSYTVYILGNCTEQFNLRMLMPFGVRVKMRIAQGVGQCNCSVHGLKYETAPLVIISNRMFDDPSPLCSPFPRLPLIAGCVKFNRIRTDKGHLRGCAKLEVRVTGTDAILWDMQFSCFKIGTDGIIFNNPNKNKEKPKPVKEPVNKPMKKPNEECH